MTYENAGSLEHIRLLAGNKIDLVADPHLGTHDLDAYLYQRANLVDTVHTLGGLIVPDTNDPSLHETVFDGDAHAYTLNGVEAYTGPILERLPELVPDLVQPKQTIFTTSEADALRNSLPYVLVFSSERGGDGKYLIETEAQHDKAYHYVQTRLRSVLGPKALGRVIAKEYIEPPSPYYTSLRLMTTATGTPFAAALLYSSHTKGDKRKVHSFDALSDVSSPYYIAARDIRSNVSQGGRAIPLMGDNRRKIHAHEKEILDAHGFDPDNPQIPDNLLHINADIVRHYSRMTGMHLGLDYIQSKSGTAYFLESNVGPGHATYAACHTANRPIDYLSMYAAINNRIITDMQTSREANRGY